MIKVLEAFGGIGATTKALKNLGIDFIGGFSALVEKGFTQGDTALIDAIPEALSVTDRLCSSVNVGSSKAGINMDAVLKMAETIKKSADIGIRNVFGEAPNDMNIVGGVISSNASESHLIAEKKTNEQMDSERQQMLDQLKEKVKSGELSLAQASELSAKINSSFGFYDKEEEIKGRHM